MKSLAILILTKNEEANIIDVVRNAKQCTDEVIIIDSGSTDKTVELAKQEGAVVAFRAWDNDFSAQRNFALTQTQADWVLYLDADERLVPETIDAIQKILQSDDMNSQYKIKRCTKAFGKLFRHGALGPDEVIRMFPRKSVKWAHKVHEHPNCKLPMKSLAGYLEHNTYVDWDEWEGKMKEYSSIWAKDRFDNGKRISAASILGHAVGAFIKMFFLRQGFLDGWLGVYMCFAYSNYTMLKYLKLLELQQ